MSPASSLYADLPARLLSLQAQAVAAYVQHALRPRVVGTDSAFFKLWAAAYEVRAALADQNPAWASTLLPKTRRVPTTGVGLPLVPAGVRWAVDEVVPGQITLTVDVAGPVTFSVLAPGGKTPFVPTVTLAATRATSTFAAPLGGLYTVTIRVGTARLATLYVPVTRAEFRLFREDSRALCYAFTDTLPRPQGTYVGRLARLAAGEAAARCSQAPEALALFASARALPAAPSPVALYPYPRR